MASRSTLLVSDGCVDLGCQTSRIHVLCFLRLADENGVKSGRFRMPSSAARN